MNDPEMISLQDVPEADKCDTRYRRGYCHGYGAAIRDMAKSNSTEMRRFFKYQLEPWRRQKPSSDVILPPILEVKS